MLSLALFALLAAAAVEEEPVVRRSLRIGVSPIRGDESTLAEWAPLEQRLEATIAGLEVELEPLALDDVLPAAQEQRVDLVIHQPALAARLVYEAGGRELLAVRRRVGDTWQTRFGSVVFTRADWAGGDELEDARGAHVVAVGPRSFGGWLVAQHAWQRDGVECEDFASLTFTGLPHDQVVERVLSGASEVGVVRTGLLESLANEGRLDLDTIRVLRTADAEPFPVRCSTRLYPEFAMIALPGVDAELAREIAASLLSTADGALGEASWGMPRDLSDARELLRDLGLPPYEIVTPPIHRQVLAHPAFPWAIGLSVSAMAFGLCIYFRERLRAERLRLSLLAAEAVDQSRLAFLANMSHEIRTPMTAIMGFSELLSQGELIASALVSQTEAVGSIKHNCEHLLRIIDDILDMSKVEAGAVEIETLEVDLGVLVREVQSGMSSRADAKRIGLEVHFDGPLPTRVLTDPTRVRQILFNLVGNAIKFTEKGQVAIEVAFRADSERLELAVRDTGIGMTEKQRRVVARFSPFVQAAASTTRTHGGTGLGLAISAGLARRLGGDLEVESALGQGTCFHVSLRAPLAPGATLRDPSVESSAEPSARPAAELETDLTSLRILLVEDGRDNQRLIGFLLRKAGATVEVADDGAQAVERMTRTDASEPIDLILMDMQMPVLDGYAATRELRSKGFELPILALTAHAMSGDEQRCLDAGCDDFLTKPVDRSALLAACARFGGRSGDAAA
ncbi:MAG: PhnD/SsuA/transferrin family substrate-binding protein [Planctomycetota bacterium]